MLEPEVAQSPHVVQTTVSTGQYYQDYGVMVLLIEDTDECYFGSAIVW